MNISVSYTMVVLSEQEDNTQHRSRSALPQADGGRGRGAGAGGGRARRRPGARPPDMTKRRDTKDVTRNNHRYGCILQRLEMLEYMNIQPIGH